MKQFFGISLGAIVGVGSLVFSTIALANPTPVISESPQSRQYQLLGLSFETPWAFSPPAAITEGVAVVYPPSARPGEHELLVGLVEVPGMESVLGNLSPSELMHWLRHSLDLAPASSVITPVSRTILGRRIQGESLVKNPGTPIYQEVYVVRLSQGGRLAIKFEAADAVPLAQIEAVFTQVAASFQELEPRSRAWRQSMEWWRTSNTQAPQGANPSVRR